MNTFTDAGAQNDFAKIRHFNLFLKLADIGFDFEGWIKSLDIPKSEWCPFWEQHSNKDEGFKPYSAPGERWGCTCLHDCRKDLSRGCGRIDPITHEPKQDRAKYLYAHGLRHDVTDAAQWLEWCDDDVRKAWARHFAKDRAEKNQRHRAVFSTVSTTLDMVEILPVEWISEGWLVANAVNMIVGATGIGKSQMAINVVAAVTKGRPWRPQDTARPRAEVVVISGEDNTARALAPRCAAAGVDLSKVHHITKYTATAEDGTVTECRFRLANAVDCLANFLESHPAVRLVVIDPMNAYIGGKTDAHRNAEMRAALEPLSELAERYNVTFLIVHHTRKGKADKAALTDVIGGSNATIELCRAAIFLAKDPNLDDRFVAQVVKCSYAKPPDGIVYTIEGCDVPAKGNTVNHTQRVVVLENEKATPIGELLTEEGTTAPRRESAKQFIAGELADGEMDSTVLWAKAKTERLSRDAVNDAADELGVIKIKRGFQGKWYWSLPVDKAKTAWREAGIARGIDALNGVQ